MENMFTSDDYPCKSEFNEAMLEIIKQCAGEELYDQIEDTTLSNLPANYEVIDDFCAEVYSIRGSSFTLH